MILVRIILLVIFNVSTYVGSVAITDINWSGKNERVGYRYTCTGNEINLEKCSKQSPYIYVNYWFSYKRGGVDCQHHKKQGMVE